MAAMRSVSLTRQLAMLVSRVGPSRTGHHGQRHRRVGDVVAVERDGLQRPGAAVYLEPVGPALDLCTHQARGLDEADVALDGVRADTFDVHRRAAVRGDRAQRDEVGRRRGIALDVDVPWRGIAAAGRDGEALEAVALHLDAEACQQVQRDLDVGLGDQLALDLDHDGRLGGHQRQGQQQRGEELARDIPAHADRHLRIQPAATHAAQAQRWIAGLAEVFDRAAQRAQGVDQVANRPLVHALDAGEIEAPALRRGEHGERRRQWAHRRAGIAEEELGLMYLQPAGEAGDAPQCAVLFDAAAQDPQRLQHHPRVV
jgi:hypothetical protein